MDPGEFEKLSERVDILIKLMAANVIAGKSLTQQVEYLTSVGMSPSQIASTLGKPLNTVTGITSYLKKKAAKS